MQGIQLTSVRLHLHEHPVLQTEAARFLTPDSYTGNPYNPNTQNVYSYANNNPVNFIDLTGHSAIVASLGLGVAGAAGTVVLYAIVIVSFVITVCLVKEAVESISYALATSDSNETDIDNEDKKKLEDGAKMPTEDALDAAEDFLGPDYEDLGDGRYRSADGTRQVRMGDADITGQHYEGPHMNFETWEPEPKSPGRWRNVSNIHIILEDAIN